MDDSATTATLYLKRLIEQRTDQRIVVTLHPSEEENTLGEKQQPVAMQMIVTNDEKPTHLNPNMLHLDGRADNGYHILISHDFWNRLSAELKIILQGAGKDTINYFSELKRKI